jgi:hypothetical protein
VVAIGAAHELGRRPPDERVRDAILPRRCSQLRERGVDCRHEPGVLLDRAPAEVLELGADLLLGVCVPRRLDGLDGRLAQRRLRRCTDQRAQQRLDRRPGRVQLQPDLKLVRQSPSASSSIDTAGS